jgi:phosphatidylinositol 4-kinase B
MTSSSTTSGGWFQSDSARSSLNTPPNNHPGEEEEEDATIRPPLRSTEDEDENTLKSSSRKNNAPSSSHLSVKERGTKGFPGRVSSNSNIAGMITHQSSSSNIIINNNRPSSPSAKMSSPANANDLLVRFFESEFFDEWIAISYLWRAKNENIVEYLCNKMLMFDDDRAERYLSQILTLLTQRKMPKLENVVCAYCSRSARLASKTIWLLRAAIGDVKHPKPLIKLKVRCYKAAIESGTWRSPFEKWPGLPDEKTKEMEDEEEIFDFDTSREGSRHLKRSTLSSPSSSRNNMITSGSEDDEDEEYDDDDDDDDDSAYALGNNTDGVALRGRGAVGNTTSESSLHTQNIASTPPNLEGMQQQQQQQHHHNNNNNNNNSKKKSGDVLLSVPNTPSKSGWLFGHKNAEEKLLKTPPSSPPQKQKSLEKGHGSNSSSTGFLSQLFGKLTSSSKLHDKSYSSSPSKANNLASGGDSRTDSPQLQNAALQKVREREKKRRQSTFDQTSDLAENLCGLSSQLAKTFPVDSRQNALRNGIEEVNKKLVNVPSGTGVMYPLGAIGEYRIVRIPAQEAMLLNSREKAPYLICFEVIRPNAEYNNTGGENSYSEGMRADDRADSMSSNNSFSSRSNARRNPFVHASNADDNGASEMSAQGHERKNSALLSLGESGALDIPMGGGRRHGRAGSYDASTLPVPDEEFLARSLREQESLELAASKIAEQRLSFDKPRPVLRMHKDQAMSVPPSAETTPQKQPPQGQQQENSWNPKSLAGGFSSFISNSLSPMLLPDIKEVGSAVASPNEVGSPVKDGCVPMGFNSIHSIDKMTSHHDSVSKAIDSALAKVWDETTAVVRVHLDIDENSGTVHVALEIPHLKKEEDLLKLQQQQHKKSSFFSTSWSKKEPKVADIVDPAKVSAKPNSRHARTPSDVGLVQMARRMRRGSDDANWAPEAEARDVTRNPRGGSIMEQLSPFLGTIGSDDDNEIDEFEENFQPNQSKLGSVPTSPTSLQFHKRSAGGLGERWIDKVERIRRASPYGNQPGWCLKPIIVKAGDNCRQELLAIQLVRTFAGIYADAGLPLWIKDYEVLTTSTTTAFIEAVTDAPSLHAVKSRAPRGSTLKQHFESIYNGYGSPEFRVAQRNFVESLAGYSILTYLLQIKDRHNGNILLREDGRLIHIDFNFMLSTSPGGINFESSPFKLTKEYLELMDSDADGVASEAFNYYKVLCIQGYLACRKHAERILLLVEMMAHSGCPCFKAGPKVVQNLRKRFNLGRTEEQVAEIMLAMISDSMDAWSTRQYDFFQRVSNGIL